MDTSGHIGALFKRQGRLWSLLVALMLVAQIGLGIHQLHHRINPDAVVSDDCALCHFAANMAVGAGPAIITPPVLVVAEVTAHPAHIIVQPVRIVAGFKSRAPPFSISA